MAESRLILVTGATGYAGGRLVPRLLEAGYRVRCLVRDASRLQGRDWLARVELVQGDMLKPDSLVAVMKNVEAVYYLVHGLIFSGLIRGVARQAVDGYADAGQDASGT